MAPTNYKSSEYVDDSDLEEDQVQPFEPPKHYHKLSHSSKSLPKTKDKEIWLIKTPKNFPLEKLKTLPIAFTKNRVAESFEVSGSSYQVEEELSPASSSSIIPTTEINNKHTIFKAKHNSFKPTDLKISRFYNIKEVVNIPQIDFDKARVPRENVAQLKRLRMRHYPTGYSEKDFDITYDDDFDEEAGKSIKKVKVDEVQEQKHSESKHHKEKKEKKDKKDKKDKKEKKEKKSKKDH